MSVSKKNPRLYTLCLFLGFCCAWMLFSAYSLTGQAARATGTVKNPILNVRTEASTSSSIRCKLSQGMKVTILSETTGTDGMKWYNVYFSYNNEALEGYVRADLVNAAAASSSGNTGTGSSDSVLRSIRPNAAIVRSTPSTSASIQTRLYKGTIISVISEQTSTDGRKWSKVTYIENDSAKEGYIRSDLLTTAPSGATMTGASTPTPTAPSSEGTKKYIDTNVAIVRTYASTNGDIRTRLVRGTAVTVIKTVTGSDDGRTWYKVSYDSNGASGQGYIRGDLLADATANNASGNTSSTSHAGQTATVQPLVANIRSYASTNGDIRSKLSQGTIVTIVSEKNGDDGQKWYKISYTVNGSGLQGYIRGDLLTLSSETSNPGNSSSGTNSDSPKPGVAQVLSYASPNADIRATLPNGTKVSIIKEVTGEDGEKWTKIGFDLNGERVEGYVKSSILK